MARAIDADAVLDRYYAEFEKQDIFDGSQDRDWLMRCIEEAPTLTPPNEWISVEERLPGVSGNYICAVKDKNGSVWTIPAEWSLEMKMWLGAFGEIKNIVTHWMPLPAPPDRRPPEGEEDT